MAPAHIPPDMSTPVNDTSDAHPRTSVRFATSEHALIGIDMSQLSGCQLEQVLRSHRTYAAIGRAHPDPRARLRTQAAFTGLHNAWVHTARDTDQCTWESATRNVPSALIAVSTAYADRLRDIDCDGNPAYLDLDDNRVHLPDIALMWQDETFDYSHRAQYQASEPCTKVAITLHDPDDRSKGVKEVDVELTGCVWRSSSSIPDARRCFISARHLQDSLKQLDTSNQGFAVVLEQLCDDKLTVSEAESQLKSYFSQVENRSVSFVNAAKDLHYNPYRQGLPTPEPIQGRPHWQGVCAGNPCFKFTVNYGVPAQQTSSA